MGVARTLRWLGLAAALLLLALTLAVGWLLADRPSVEAMAELALPSVPAPGHAGQVTVSFLGVSTLLFHDGETALLTDGFFSRPGLVSVVLGTPVAPDAARIDAGLAAGGVSTLAALMTVHSHYDHAMDVAEVAERSGAVVLGSASTANVARGGGLAEERIVVAEPGRPYAFGDFRVTFFTSRHFPLPPPADRTLGRDIEAPLVPPASVNDYLEGGSFSILIAHPRGRALVQGSAGYVPGALADVDADVVLLGIGGLSQQDREYTAGYWREVVAAVGARRVLPIHWDDFTRPLGPELVPFFRRLDDVERSLAWLAEEAGAAPATQLGWLPPLEPVALY